MNRQGRTKESFHIPRGLPVFRRGSLFGAEHAGFQNGHDGLINDGIDLVIVHILKYGPQAQEIGDAHEHIGHAGDIGGGKLLLVLAQGSGIAFGKGYIVIFEHLLLNGQRAPNDVIHIGVFYSIADEAFDTFPFPLRAGLATLDGLGDTFNGTGSFKRPNATSNLLSNTAAQTFSHTRLKLVVPNKLTQLWSSKVFFCEIYA